jgi:hypothetical protein
MRLTVGSLPAGVYWRRRALVFVGLAMVVLVISYACGGPDVSKAGAQDSTHSTPSASAGSSQHGGPSPTPTIQTPFVPTQTTPQPTAFSLPLPGATGPCTDAEIDLTATAAAAVVQGGHSVDVTIRIRNTSSRTCGRDVGADMQELRLMDKDIVIWSSDDCNARHGADVRSLAPGKEVSFTLNWAGSRSRTGAGAVNCGAPAPQPAPYQLIARLDRKLSTPFDLRVT